MECRSMPLLVAACVAAFAAGCTGDVPVAEYQTYKEKQAARIQAEEPTAGEGSTEAESPADAVAGPAAASRSDNVPPVQEAAVVAATVELPEGMVVPPADALAAENLNAPRIPELLIAHKDFRPEPRTGDLRVSYDDIDLLKVLNMEPVTADAVNFMPDWLRSLNGKRIRIRGFMYPTFEPTGIEKFLLARDNQICCFGRDPKVYDLIAVEMRPGKTTNYIPNRPFDVSGIFRVEMVAEGDKPLGLYWMSDAEISLK